jgi:GLPGLI family protein
MRPLLLHFVSVFLMTVSTSVSSAQKIYNEGFVNYAVVVSQGKEESKAADLLEGATQRIYFKGAQSRSEITSILGTTIILHDNKSGNAVVLNEYGDQKILIRMKKVDFEEKNNKYEGIQYEFRNETKTILGYVCKLAVGKLKDGTSFKVYYSTDFTFQSKDYGFQFRDLPGIPMEYESEFGKLKVTYVADRINFDQVAAVLFDIPKSGYREMTYEEVKKTQMKN